MEFQLHRVYNLREAKYRKIELHGGIALGVFYLVPSTRTFTIPSEPAMRGFKLVF